MDKNLINIDDLVRQRLGGGEEQEQAGSWGRMRDLLDKEMPQKPAGMYWRRSLSAIALLLLVAGVSIGGYEIARSGHIAANNTGTANTGAAAVATADGNIAPDAGKLNNNNNDKKTNNNKTAETVAINTTTATTAKNNNSSSNSDKTIRIASATDARPDGTNNMPVKESKKHKVAVTGGNNRVAAVHHAKVPVDHTGKKEQPFTADDRSAIVKNADKAGNAVEHSNNRENRTSKAIAKNIGKKDNKEDNTTGSATGSKEAMDAMALGSAAPSVANEAGSAKNKRITGTSYKTNRHNIATNARTNNSAVPTAPVAVNNESAANDNDNDNNITGKNASGTVKNSRHIAAGRTVAGNTNNKKAVARSTPVTAMPVLGSAVNITGNNVNKTGVVNTTPAHKAQKLVQRLVLTQRMVRVSATQIKYVMDTISLESAMEDYDAAMAPPAFGPQTYDVFLANMDENSTVTAAKDNNREKKAKGSTSLESLSAAFNDMKTKVKGAHFSPGLTAGINGTFFGPNSFKGFQFGITGNMSFGERLAIMGELKYFHRINNDYTLSDNYYNYTPAAAGGYTKTMVVNPYSFSTLHSIELPISVRYCIGNFNFFVGGNLEYSFAVNTGAYPLADPSSATQVAAIGNDNAPKISNDDFSSRFGLGYLVGASCQVSPNVMIDFRNVQNVWDNSKTAGAKVVSGQLYRSPSLQLSIGYRLGANKGRNKE